MSGKAPLLGVMGFGLIAAACAALLMAALRTEPGSASARVPTTTDVVVAASDIHGLARLDETLVEVRAVPISEAPEARFEDPVSVVGRILNTPAVAGQPITKTMLLQEGDGAKLAMSLPEGVRAVSIELPPSSAMHGLLYPGSRVDVLVTFQRRGYGSAGGGSRTLLQNVRVLAVEHRTVFTEEDEEAEEDEPPPARRPGQALMVTLMVTPEQAAKLASARGEGTLALSLRNPLDETVQEEHAEPLPPPEEPEPTEIPEHWRTLVIRGGETEVLSFKNGRQDATTAGDAGGRDEREPEDVDPPEE